MLETTGSFLEVLVGPDGPICFICTFHTSKLLLWSSCHHFIYLAFGNSLWLGRSCHGKKKKLLSCTSAGSEVPSNVPQIVGSSVL